MKPKATCRLKQADGTELVLPIDRVSADQVVAAHPVRSFHWYKGKKHYSGWMYSTTMNDLIPYESITEYTRAELADFDKSVITIASQPFQLIWRNSRGPEKKAIPDFLLRHVDRSVTVVEVKAGSAMENPDVKRRMRAVKKIVTARGWNFELWTPNSASATYTANVCFLAGFKSASRIDPQVLSELADSKVCRETPRGLTELLRRFDRRIVLPAVWHCLWTGALHADLAASPLSLSTLLWSEMEDVE